MTAKPMLPVMFNGATGLRLIGRVSDNCTDDLVTDDVRAAVDHLLRAHRLSCANVSLACDRATKQRMIVCWGR